MKLYSCIFLSTVLIGALAVPAFCQKPSPFPDPAPSPDLVGPLADQAKEMAADAAALSADSILTFDLEAPKLNINIDAAALEEQAAHFAEQIDSAKIDALSAKAAAIADRFDLTFLQAPTPPVPPRAPKAPTLVFRGRDDAYNAGTRALDDHKYEEAVQHFDSAIAQEPARADGALYWKAYALNREGKRDEALAAIAKLRADYATSAWLHDADALEAEVKQSNGQPVSAAQESNDDLKLYAINGLMNADAERAIPLVENILKSNSTPAIKDRALFVIAQNKSPRAQQALLDYAKGGGNPDLQLRAIQYVGMSGTKEAQQQLVGIYTSSADTRVKSAIVQALMMAHASDALLNIAKTEKDPSLRGTAIRTLVMTKSVPVEGLVELYGSSDAVSKKEIVNGLQARNDAKTMVDLARKETDPAMKKTIVERLSTMHDNKDAMDYMMELLK